MNFSVLVQFLGGLTLLVIGAEIMVRGAARLAAALGVSALVIGLTVVAFGTSSPELAVSLHSSFQGQGGIALGNVVGSNIFNVLLILGLSATIIPLAVDKQLVRLDVPLMISASVVAYFFMLDGHIVAWEGAILFVAVILYTAYLIRASRRQSSAVQAEYDQEYGDRSHEHTPSMWLTNIGLVLGGFAMLIFGSRLLVSAASSIAHAFGVSDVVIGLTVVAAGTSMPEVATSIVAAIRGQRDIAVGNVVGSNLFNLLAVLGLTGLVAPGGIPVPASALAFDVPFMVIVAVACLPIFFTGNVIARWEGLLFLAYYVAYTTYLVMTANASNGLPLLEDGVLFFLIPLTLLTIIITVYREVRERQLKSRTVGSEGS